jgi:hypothetical protein
MSKGRSLHQQTAFAIVRVDEFSSDKPTNDTAKSGPEIRIGKYEIKVKEVVLSLEEAERETKRLNEVNKDKQCHYFWQSTHLFLDGGSHGSLTN